ncbi:hypothetical protein ACLEPN_37140, partial [Myxococcus sp. 1LA]
MDLSLAQAFVAARGGTAAASPESLALLQARLAQALDTARAPWPGVALEGPRFASHLARLLPDEGTVETLNLSDLYLARAAADGLPPALSAFESRFLPEVDVAVARLKLPPTGLDEVRQLLRQRMLVGGRGDASPAGRLSRHGAPERLGARRGAVARPGLATAARR